MKEVSEGRMKQIYLNVLKAIVVVLYFFTLVQIYENVDINSFDTIIKIITMIILFVAIFIFEIAYRKDDEILALQGIEIFVISTVTLTTEYITRKYNFGFKNYSYVLSYIIAIYFIMKGLIVYTRGRKEVVDSMSDIREIVKKEEPSKKEAIKRGSEDD